MRKKQLGLIGLTFVLSALLLTTSQGAAFGSNDNGEADEWLAGIFPKINNCTPKDWSKVEGLLESEGYKKKGFSEYEKGSNVFVSRFDIREKFFGFNAVEMAIPGGEVSIYAVTVKASPKELAAKIYSVTGKKIHVYQGEANSVKSGRAYINPRGNNKSEFVCFTDSEGE